uniref:Uncharacterized protein n=1 Tax=Arundo donax TaxID=35708 RepID=A0A0A8YLI5_ARUDO
MSLNFSTPDMLYLFTYHKCYSEDDMNFFIQSFIHVREHLLLYS